MVETRENIFVLKILGVKDNGIGLKNIFTLKGNVPGYKDVQHLCIGACLC